MSAFPEYPGTPDMDGDHENSEFSRNNESIHSEQSSTIEKKPGKKFKNSSKMKRKLTWDIPHVIVILCIFLSYLYQYNQQDRNVFIYIVILTVSVGVTTAMVWRFMAIYTVEAFDSVFDLLRGKHSMICQMKSPQSETRSLLDHLYMAVEWAFFPTLVVFFVLSFIAGAITPEGKAITDMWWAPLLMFLIPPLVTFITIPIRLIADSSFMRYDVQNRTLEPFGLTFQRMFKAVGGVGAFASFAKVSLEKGGFEGAIVDTFTILLYVFPTIFIATLFYGAWHPQYLRKVEEKIDKFDFQTYELVQDGDGILRLLHIANEIDTTGSDMKLPFETTVGGMPFPTPVPSSVDTKVPDQYDDTVPGLPEDVTPPIMQHQNMSIDIEETGVHGENEMEHSGSTTNIADGKNVFHFGEVEEDEDNEEYLDLSSHYEPEHEGKMMDGDQPEEPMSVSDIRAFEEEKELDNPVEEEEYGDDDVKNDVDVMDENDRDY